MSFALLCRALHKMNRKCAAKGLKYCLVWRADILRMRGEERPSAFPHGSRGGPCSATWAKLTSLQPRIARISRILLSYPCHPETRRRGPVHELSPLRLGVGTILVRNVTTRPIVLFSRCGYPESSCGLAWSGKSRQQVDLRSPCKIGLENPIAR